MISFSPPDISELEIAEVAEALRSGWITTGPRTKQLEKEIARLEHQKKIKQHEAKQLERNRRNRRIFTRGGMLERFMQRPLLLTDDQVYQLLQTAFNTEAVQTMEKALINEAVKAVTQAAEDTNPDAKA